MDTNYYDLSFFQNITLLLAGSITFPLQFLSIKKALTKYLMPKYSKYDVYDISNKTVSAFYSITCSIVGQIITRRCSQNVMYNRHILTNNYAWFGWPYFFYDTWCMFQVHCTKSDLNGSLASRWKNFVTQNRMMMFHHLGLCVIGFPLVVWWRCGKGDFFVGCIYMAELSTPLVCLRAILSRLKLKKSLLYLLNGIAMIIIFAYCRIWVFYFMYRVYGEQENISVSEAITSMPWYCNFAVIVMLAPQLFWFSIMCRGAFIHLKNFGYKKL